MSADDSEPGATLGQASVATYQVEGMTCGHCASAVQAEIGALPGVRSVDVDLHAGKTSSVMITSAAPLTAAALAAALTEAGDYQLVANP